jgi:transcription termination factor Rho
VSATQLQDRPTRRSSPSKAAPVADLVTVSGVLEMQGQRGHLRVAGYLPGPGDVQVPPPLVKRHDLRPGDQLTGQADRTTLATVETVNGRDPARSRPEFYELTPQHPQERLLLETTPDRLTARVIDLTMPIGKGQRALILSPPKAGKTIVLQEIARAITINNPECHLMVVLVDERPEEVTDMRRSVTGEVIAATFDRPPRTHTALAELAIERAKRLVEDGHDVVVLLDSITRLARAYNLAAKPGGRTLSGGVDTTALYPPKALLGAARNIENGGSLTIIATALVETGSQMDTVIYEEFKGTGNAELRLDRRIAERRIYPAVDLHTSSTRRDEILLTPHERVAVQRLRRALHTADTAQELDHLLELLRKTDTNAELLLRIAQQQ